MLCGSLHSPYYHEHTFRAAFLSRARSILLVINLILFITIYVFLFIVYVRKDVVLHHVSFKNQGFVYHKERFFIFVDEAFFLGLFALVNPMLKALM
jgi:hypothetical protein